MDRPPRKQQKENGIPSWLRDKKIGLYVINYSLHSKMQVGLVFVLSKSSLPLTRLRKIYYIYIPQKCIIKAHFVVDFMKINLCCRYWCIFPINLIKVREIRLKIKLKQHTFWNTSSTKQEIIKTHTDMWSRIHIVSRCCIVEHALIQCIFSGFKE